MQVRVFGRTRIDDPDRGDVAAGGAASRRLLTTLAVRWPTSVSAEALLEVGWPGADLRSPRSSLRMAVTRLRRQLGGDDGEDAIVGGAGGYRLGEHISIDTHTFSREVASTSIGPISLANLLRLTEALDLWTGDPYLDGEGHLFEAERTELIQRRASAARRAFELGALLGRNDLTLDPLQRVLQDQPWHEGIAADVMRASYALGDQRRALETFDQTRAWLREELGLDPSPDLADLQRGVLDHDVDLLGDLPTVSVARSVVRPTLAALSLARSDDAGRSRSQAIGERAAGMARLGHWADATQLLTSAIDLAHAAGRPIEAAGHALELARITWDPTQGEIVAARIRSLLPLVTDASMSARLRLCLAGGVYRSGVSSSGADNHHALRDDLALVRSTGTNRETGWALTHFRDAVAGVTSIAEAEALCRSIAELVGEDDLLHGQNLRAHFSQLLMANRRDEAAEKLAIMERDLADDVAAVNEFGTITARNAWELAHGRYDLVRDGLDRALLFAEHLASATYDQVVLGQSFWLARELGDPESIDELRGGARALAATNADSPLWLVAAAVLGVDVGDHEGAAADLTAAHKAFDLAAIAPGPHRIGILGFVAETLARLRAADALVDVELSRTIARELEAEDADAVLFGWPTVFAGAKARFLAFASFAADDRTRGRHYAQAAVAADEGAPPLHRRSIEAAQLLDA